MKLNELKQWVRGALRSKTMWFNAAVLFVAHNPDLVLSTLADNLPGVAAFIPPGAFREYLLTASGVINLWLRMKTSVSLKAKAS